MRDENYIVHCDRKKRTRTDLRLDIGFRSIKIERLTGFPWRGKFWTQYFVHHSHRMWIHATSNLRGPASATGVFTTHDTKGHPYPEIVTGRNKVLAKVIFLHLSVILFTGGGLARRTPPGMESPPLDQTPPNMETPGPDPPHHGETPPPAWRTPPDQTPSRHGEPPSPTGKQTPAYGLRSAGTHPTGMHSCWC